MGIAPSDFRRQPQGSAAAGVETALNLQHLEQRVRGRHANLGVEHDLDAPGETVALGCHDQRLAMTLPGQPEWVNFTFAYGERLAGPERLGPLVQFNTRGEVPTLGRQHTDTYVRIGVHLRQVAAQLVVHLHAQRVVFLRSGQLDVKNVALPAGSQMCHGVSCCIREAPVYRVISVCADGSRHTMQVSLCPVRTAG